MAKGIRVQPRDLAIFAELGELGILDSETIRERHFPHDNSGKATPRKLKQYAENRFIRSKKLQIGTREITIHQLTPEGAAELENRTGEVAPRAARAHEWAKNDFLAHGLGVVKTRLALSAALAAASLPEASWIHEHDPIPGTPRNGRWDERMVLYEAFGKGDDRVACRPDASFQVLVPGPSSPARLIGYLEYDRGTNKIDDEAAKLPGYASLLGQHLYRKHWPAEERLETRVRIIYVCPSENRVELLRKGFEGKPGSEAVRFVTEPSLFDPAQVLFEPIWQTVNGERGAMLRQPSSS